MRHNLVRALFVAVLAAYLAACGSIEKILPGERADYKRARQVNSLEVPPDLTKPGRDQTMAVPDISPSGTATYSDYASERRGDAPVRSAAGVLPKFDNVAVERTGQQRWLVVNGDVEQVWPTLREFWLQNGFVLETDNPTIGIMETGWSENRADIPGGPIRSFLEGTLGGLYSAATRDKFRVRVERGSEPGTTEVYLTHKGVEEVIQGDNVSPEGTIWKPRPSDPELEAEMLRRLMVFIGVEEQRARRMVAGQQARPANRARLSATAEGEPVVIVNEPFSRAWRLTGLALDEVGFNVQDRDRAQGIYFVRYEDPRHRREEGGFWSKLAFWRSDEPEHPTQYQVRVQAEGERTRLSVRDADGKPDRSDTGRRILNLLHEQLR